MQKAEQFRKALRAREPLFGVFVKIPHPHIVEVLASSPLDFVVLDAEHSPFSLSQLDTCILATQTSSMNCLVRVSSHNKEEIGAVLDLGADGIVVPHIKTRDDAKKIISAALYHEGERGVSMSHRAGAYGSAGDVFDYTQLADASTSIIVQIEECEAVENLSDLLLEDRLDGFFIGKVDLAYSYGSRALDDAELSANINSACDLIKQANRALGSYVTDANRALQLSESGHSFIALGSDHTHLKASVRNQLAEIISPGRTVL
ncbi:MAG: aldolase/citrate lyase family protein [Pseudomonadota bacterium]